MNRSGAFASVVVAAVLAGGCTTLTPISDGGTDPVAGWNAETRDLASRSWLYAQLSTNAYQDFEMFTLPGDVVQRPSSGNDGVGYAYVIFDRFEGDQLAETIIAYRGTEADLANGYLDITLGSVLGLHHDRGLATATAVENQLASIDTSQPELAVTGHSLGGAIAHHVTDHLLGEDGPVVARSIVFNDSPRVVGFGIDDVDRTAIVESGDFVGALRALGHSSEDVHYPIDCQAGFAPFRAHAIRDLAECLTWIAAYDDPAARLSLAENPNFGRPSAQADDQVPPVADTLGDGVPINPYVDDVEMRIAIDARLRASPTLSPYYEGRSGYRVVVEYDRQAGTALARWFRNGIAIADQPPMINCSAIPLARCADLIISPAETLIAEELIAVDGE